MNNLIQEKSKGFPFWAQSASALQGEILFVFVRHKALGQSYLAEGWHLSQNEYAQPGVPSSGGAQPGNAQSGGGSLGVQQRLAQNFHKTLD